MKEIIKSIIAVLKDLIKSNKDEYLLFESSSLKSEDAELQPLLNVYTNELEKEVIRSDGFPETNKNNSENSNEFYESFIFENNWDNLIADA
jgi:hypothetical protein